MPTTMLRPDLPPVPSLRWLFTELGSLRATSRLGEHPYLVALGCGALSRDDLLILTTEHDHLVVAQAETARLVSSHYDMARDAEADIGRWRTFSVAAGWCHSSQWFYGSDPHSATLQARRTILATRSRRPEDDLAVLWALQVVRQDAMAIGEGIRTSYRADAAVTEWFDHAGATSGRLAAIEAAIEACECVDPVGVLLSAQRCLDAVVGFFDELQSERAERTHRRLPMAVAA